MFGVKIFVAVVVTILVLWFLELFTRKRTNWRGLRHGLAFRWRTRIHMPLDTTEEDGVDDTDNQDEQIHELLLYPLSTNLLRQPVAGPGLCLHMNFFVAMIIWSAVIVYMYALAACMVSVDMLVIGLTPAKTSQQLCAVVHWGHDAQVRLLCAKTGFVIFAYLFTFLGCMYLALYQNREFHRLDDDTTLKDFVAFASNLPIAKGTENPEDEIKKFLEDQTHEKIRGVSVAWNYTSKEKEVTAAIEADWKEREAVLAPPLPTAEEESQNPTPKQPPLGLVRRLLRKVDNLLDGLLWQSPTNPPPESGAAPAEGADAPFARCSSTFRPLRKRDGHNAK